MSDLLITINADAKSLKQAFDDVKSQTESLEDALASIAKVSGVAFAALAAQVTVAVHEFAAADTASRQLSETLQDQGVFTEKLKDSYAEYAEGVSQLTGVSKTQITAAQSVAQTYLGQIPVTKELTQSIVDLAAKQGIGLPEAAAEMGKAIGNGTGMLLRQGLTFSSTSTEAQRFNQTMEFVKTYSDGAANAISPVTLATKKLTTAFEESQVELGSRFAPAITTVINSLTSFLTPAKDSTGAMVDLKAILIVTGLAVTGLGVALPALSTGFLVVRAAAKALELELTGVKVALYGLGIGVVIAALVELVVHFDQVKAVASGVFQFLKDGFSGVGKIIAGVITHNVEMIQDGVKQMGDAWGNSTKAYQDSLKAQEAASVKHEDVQVQAKKDLADKLAAQKKAQADAAIALQKEEDKLIQMEINGASDEQLELEKQKIETLKLLANKKNGDDKSILQARIVQITALQTEADAQEVERTAIFNKAKVQSVVALDDTIDSYNTKMSKKEENAIKKTAMTEKQAEQKVYQDKLKETISRNNTFLQEQAKYGTAYATINEVIHSSEIQGLQQATGDLVQMTNSKNATLKEIGKIAAIENIIIKTAESAMNIFTGFSSIPIVGYALGIAGAAAAVVYGAEQIGNVTAAATGGLVGGVGSGDTQPYLLTPGEVVTPKQNYEELINGAIQQRGYVQPGQAGSGNGNQNVAVQIGFDGRQAQQVLTAQQVQAKALGTYRASS